MGQLIGLAFALACLLFTLSLPLGGLGAGDLAKSLKRTSLFLFVLALGPSLFFGALKEAVGSSASGSASSGSTNPLAVIGGLALLCGGAYLALQIRKRTGRSKGDAMSDYFQQRSSGKRPVRREDEERSRFPF